MQQIGAWQITDEGTTRLSTGNVGLEKHLEEWIERDANLVESGLIIVGRQLHCEAGYVDLLAVDASGRWVLIEIKKGMLKRKATAQALDYASCLTKMPHAELEAKINGYLAEAGGKFANLTEVLQATRGVDEIQDDDREIIIYLVGLGRDQGLDRLVAFLGDRSDLVVRVLTFQVFETSAGRVLVRELTEADAESKAVERKPQVELKDVLGKADQSGVGEAFRRIYDAATGLGLYARPYKRSIMYTSSSNRSRCIFTVWTDPPSPGKLKAWISTDNIPQLVGGSQEDVVAAFGDDGHLVVDAAAVDDFVARLRTLFERVQSEE